MRYHLTASILLFLFSGKHIHAQDAEKNISVLLIPYLPEYYLSDAERDIMEQSHRDPEAYRHYFRNTLDLKIQAELESLGVCHSMMQDTSRNGQMLLGKFYEKTAYSYEQAVGGIRTKGEHFISKVTKKKEEVPEQHTAHKSIITHGEEKFMQAAVRDTAFLSSLASKTQAGVFVSINQIEIRTHYNTCIDIANKVYQRELIVHYSVFNKSGTQLRGDYLKATFPSNSSRDRDIAERLFPGIAASLREEVEKCVSQSGKE